MNLGGGKVLLQAGGYAATYSNEAFEFGSDNYSIDQLSEVLDTDNFFQVNRKYVLNFELSSVNGPD